jgi:AcrR family transcriptional regulator
MGLLERKEREKLELRGQILEAATELFLKEGFDKTSMRGIAEMIEYSPATIYSHFKDKNEIFEAIHNKGFDMFFEKLSQSLSIENPFLRLRKMGDLYLEFAFENPEYYDLMFIMRAPMIALEQVGCEWNRGFRTYELAKATIREAIEKGLMKNMDVDVAAVMIVSTMHGMASLAIRERFKMYDKELLPFLFKEAIDNLMKMFKA